jgi:beta-ureidopropionase / N-carbamoyl-L-amino-acid hydrolase
LATLVPNATRLQRTIDDLGAFGYREGHGVTRPSLSAEDMAGRRYVIDLMAEAGLTVRVDPVGNIIGTRLGLEPALPPVATGSHIDTVVEGGKYDGMVGVLGGIEVARLFDEAGLSTLRSLEVIAFTGEEQGGFRTGTKGSKAMAGKLTPDHLRQWRDEQGVSFWDSLAQAGYHPENLAEAARPPGSLFAYVELHIEQGKILEDAGKSVGIVTAIAGLTQYRVQIKGSPDHSGGTPMELRRDALVAAAEMVLAVERLARSESVHRTVGTVGDLRVSPGMTVVVPGKAELWIDVRGVDDASKRRVLAGIDDTLTEVCGRRGLACERSVIIDDQALPMSRLVIDELRAAGRDLGLEPLAMPSGANHDARHLAAITEVGMLFVPSVGGVSHSPEEYTAIKDICAGVQVLAHALLRLASR